MKSLACLVPFLLAATAYAAPPASSDPPAPVVPPFVLPPTPAPEPLPPPIGTPIQLLPGHPFVVRINAATVLASPEGLVKMKVKAEPLTVVDAEGVDTEYTGDKSVCFVWPVKGAAGPCELLIVPTDGSAIGRVKLMVGGGPPPPPPPPPGPTDPLAAKFQAAYSLDADAGKAKYAAFLASIYGTPAAVLTPDIKTNADLFGKLSKAIHTPVIGIPSGSMTNLIGAIGTELSASIGVSASAPIDVAKTMAELTRISQALSEVK